MSGLRFTWREAIEQLEKDGELRLVIDLKSSDIFTEVPPEAVVSYDLRPERVKILSLLRNVPSLLWRLVLR